MLVTPGFSGSSWDNTRIGNPNHNPRVGVRVPPPASRRAAQFRAPAGNLAESARRSPTATKRDEPLPWRLCPLCVHRGPRTGPIRPAPNAAELGFARPLRRRSRSGLGGRCRKPPGLVLRRPYGSARAIPFSRRSHRTAAPAGSDSRPNRRTADVLHLLLTRREAAASLGMSVDTSSVELAVPEGRPVRTAGPRPTGRARALDRGQPALPRRARSRSRRPSRRRSS